MRNSLTVTPLHGSQTRPCLHLDDHPVFQALPPRAQAMADAKSRLIHLMSGEVAPQPGHLHFVLAGVLGLSPGDGRICVSAIVAGAVHGWEHAVDPNAPHSVARALVNTLVSQVPVECIIDVMGPEWLTRLVARQSTRRCHSLAEEAACNASHLVVERLAKWLVRLHCGANGAPLSLTQADFGAMLGVQRTSVNAAAGRLQAEGLARFGRGKVHVTDLAGLREVSCGCGDVKRVHVPALEPRRIDPACWWPTMAPPSREGLPVGRVMG